MYRCLSFVATTCSEDSRAWVRPVGEMDLSAAHVARQLGRRAWFHDSKHAADGMNVAPQAGERAVCMLRMPRQMSDNSSKDWRWCSHRLFHPRGRRV